MFKGNDSRTPRFSFTGESWKNGAAAVTLPRGGRAMAAIARPIPQVRIAELHVPRDLGIVWFFVATKLLVHFLFNGGYGYFRDELYYLACAEHLDWGYVDQPPLVAGVAWLVRHTIDDSLFALRLFPALAGAAKILLTGLLVREFGGGRLAQGIACACVLFAPGFLAIDNFLSMNAFEPVFWMGCALVLVRLVKTEDGRLWVWFGVLAGLGLQNKHSMLFFGFAAVVALLFTRHRRWLASKWMWMGGAIALLIFLPNLMWQIQRDFPTLELLQNVKATGKNIVLNPLEYLGRQAFLMGFVNTPVWLAGLWFLFYHRIGRHFRVLGWTYLLLLALFIVFEAKDYYLGPIYPLLFAGGAVALEPLLGARRIYALASLALITAMGVFGALLMMPILPVEQNAALLRWTGLQPPRSEVSHTSELPQHLSDQFGWEAMAAEVARIYHALPPEEREVTAIFGENYGQAAAIDFFGPRYGLPRAISPHQNYFYWGPRQYTGEIVIVLGSDREDLEEVFESVEEVGRTNHPWAMPEENGPIYLCRRLRTPLGELWPKIKRWR